MAQNDILSTHLDPTVVHPSPTMLKLHVFLPVACLLLGVTRSSAQNVPAPKASAGEASQRIEWHDVTQWGAEGRAWPDRPRQNWFDRLPAAAEVTVPPRVWTLGRDSAGLVVYFRTDAARISLDAELKRKELAGPNMSAIAASGFDLYARDATGQWRWAGSTRKPQLSGRQSLISGLIPVMRDYALYLPLYNGVTKLSVGVAPDAKFIPVPPRAEKPIVFYGTSITQGGGASRPGMTHVAILGRRLNLPVVNLGFAGNGRMDAAVGDLLVGIDAAAYVIDCLPNMNAALVRERCVPLVKRLRAAQPGIPIVLVEDRRNANAWILAGKDQGHEANHAALREAFATLQREGVAGLFYLPGDDLIGQDSEGTVDGSHPNALGIVRQADAFEPVLRAALRR